MQTSFAMQWKRLEIPSEREVLVKCSLSTLPSSGLLSFFTHCVGHRSGVRRVCDEGSAFHRVSQPSLRYLNPGKNTSGSVKTTTDSARLMLSRALRYLYLTALPANHRAQRSQPRKPSTGPRPSFTFDAPRLQDLRPRLATEPATTISSRTGSSIFTLTELVCHAK